jgi:hypothetical protein
MLPVHDTTVVTGMFELAVAFFSLPREKRESVALPAFLSLPLLHTSVVQSYGLCYETIY